MNLIENLIKALVATGLKVEIDPSWDENYLYIEYCNPNEEEDFHQIALNKKTGRFATYADGNCFIEA